MYLSSNKPLTKGHFQYDVAGCFSSNPHKAATIEWKDRMGVTEVSSRQSINGGAKTPVGGMFGQMTHHLKRANNAGKYYSCAQSAKLLPHPQPHSCTCTYAHTYASAQRATHLKSVLAHVYSVSIQNLNTTTFP
jgi:hypothetical protein